MTTGDKKVDDAIIKETKDAASKAAEAVKEKEASGKSTDAKSGGSKLAQGGVGGGDAAA